MKKRFGVISAGIFVCFLLFAGILMFFPEEQTTEPSEPETVLTTEETTLAPPTTTPEPTETEPDPTKDIPTHILEFFDEYETSVGWITIEGTNIDYPIMYHPEDNEYFLYRSVDEEFVEGGPGSIYLDSLHDLEVSGNHVIYGHNMRNGSMFHDVMEFKDEDFFNEERDIHIYTREGIQDLTPVYCYSDVADVYYRLPVLEDEVPQFLFERTGKELDAENIFVLITCSYGQEDERTYLILEDTTS